MKHEIVIPGLDRQLCGRCRKWIARPCEIERLKHQLIGANKKRFEELDLQIKKDIALAHHCPGKP